MSKFSLEGIITSDTPVHPEYIWVISKPDENAFICCPYGILIFSGKEKAHKFMENVYKDEPYVLQMFNWMAFVDMYGADYPYAMIDSTGEDGTFMVVPVVPD